jgi:pimeloyl-ACP methyl ester carboxylesterase
MSTWVLLRGLAREARHWGEFPGMLRAALGPLHRVLTPDLPGNGARCDERSPVSIGAMVEACRSHLRMDGVQGPLRIVALSMGGMAAVQWATSYPAEVAGCVLVNSSLGGLSPFWHRLRPCAWPVLLAAAAARDVGRKEERILALTCNTAQSQRVQQWASYARQSPTSRANALRQLAAAARYRVPSAAPAARLLVLASERDRLASARCSRAIAGAWAAPLHLHPWAGHDLALDDPAWLVAECLLWAIA